MVLWAPVHKFKNARVISTLALSIHPTADEETLHSFYTQTVGLMVYSIYEVMKGSTNFWRGRLNVVVDWSLDIDRLMIPEGSSLRFLGDLGTRNLNK